MSANFQFSTSTHFKIIIVCTFIHSGSTLYELVFLIVILGLWSLYDIDQINYDALKVLFLY